MRDRTCGLLQALRCVFPCLLTLFPACADIVLLPVCVRLVTAVCCWVNQGRLFGLHFSPLVAMLER